MSMNATALPDSNVGETDGDTTGLGDPQNTDTMDDTRASDAFDTIAPARGVAE